MNDGKDMAQVLNDYFVSVFTTESIDIDEECISVHSPVSIKDVDFSIDVVYKKLKGLKSNKAPGPDNIHTAVLRECCDVLSVPLSIIFFKVF